MESRLQLTVELCSQVPINSKLSAHKYMLEYILFLSLSQQSGADKLGKSRLGCDKSNNSMVCILFNLRYPHWEFEMEIKGNKFQITHFPLNFNREMTTLNSTGQQEKPLFLCEYMGTDSQWTKGSLTRIKLDLHGNIWEWRLMLLSLWAHTQDGKMCSAPPSKQRCNVIHKCTLQFPGSHIQKRKIGGMNV